MKRNIYQLGLVLMGLLLLLIGYLSYLQISDSRELASNPYNRRLQEKENQILRGNIYDINGVILAETKREDGGNRRVYPQGNLAAHILGYNSQIYGRAGLEAYYNTYLLGSSGPEGLRNFYKGLVTGEEQRGGDIHLTLDVSLQKLAEELLGNRRGAVILMDSRTGALRVVASSPRYDPNRLDQDWSALIQAEDAPLLNRATQSAYSPGSVFKLVTAAGVLASQPNSVGASWECAGYVDVDGYRLDDSNDHGQVDLTTALAVSCNVAFADLGLTMGAKSFDRACKAFGLDKEPMAGINIRPCTWADPRDMTATELAASAIGQGEVLVNPLHMALVVGAIANKGQSMRPYLVEYMVDSAGNRENTANPGTWPTATVSAIAEEIKEGMIAAVVRGTASRAAVSGVQVAGKTGSAQNPHGQTHAWFAGFAPADQPRMCLVIIVENSGAGGDIAAPIASRLIREAIAKGY